MTTIAREYVATEAYAINTEHAGRPTFAQAYALAGVDSTWYVTLITSARKGYEVVKSLETASDGRNAVAMAIAKWNGEEA